MSGINKETMNIHDALVELKTLGKRIGSEMSNLAVVSIVPTAKKDSEEAKKFSSDARAKLASIADLRRRRFAIKAAVVQSNATTYVEINGRKMSVAEIIEMRKDYISELETLRTKLLQAWNTASRRVEQDQATAVRSALQTLQAKTTEGMDEDQVKAYQSLVDMNSTVVVQPEGVDIPTLVSGIADTLDNYARLDSLLSTKNATTTIDVEYTTGEMFSEKLIIVANPADEEPAAEETENPTTCCPECTKAEPEAEG